MTGIIRKFTFDDFFDFDRQPEPAPQVAEAPPPLFTEAELTQARAEGFEEGRAQALMDHGRSDAHRLATAIERIAEGMADLGRAEAARHHDFRATSLNVAIVALRKILPELSRRFGQREIEAVVAEILGEQLEEPRLVIRVPDAAFDSLAEQIGALAAKRGYSGKTVLVADAGLGQADCRIEWADGGVERAAERTLADIAGAILRLSQINNAEVPKALEPNLNQSGD